MHYPHIVAPTSISRIRSLDGLRGVAAVGVLLGHARLVYMQNDPKPWVYMPGVRHLLDALGAWGATAVWLFFVLSGFVLALSFRNSPRTDYGVYVLRRLARLYLPVWGAVLLALVSMLFISRDVDGLGTWVGAHPPTPTPWGVIADLTLLSGTGSNVTPLWSLRWEIFFSLLLIAYIAAARSIRPGILLAVCAMLSTVGGIYENALLLYMPMFGIGVGFAFAWPTIERWATALRERLSPLLGGALAVAALVAVMGAQLAPNLLPKLGVTSSIALPAMTTLTRLVSVSLIVVLVGTSVTIGRAFSSRMILWLGMISFSLYLTHETVLLGFVYSTAANPVALAGAVALCFPVAWLFYRAVEKPAHAFAKRIGARPADTTAPTYATAPGAGAESPPPGPKP
ncbi:acyltransferase [Microbacterium algeriense]|uniref:Acyltransferase n=1 Tax=Microbacterium algeriense TaxID=2615184 RepID=A0ABQ6VGA4_9MICO|nr:acyltransferase [Microbacterium algeriense]